MLQEESTKFNEMIKPQTYMDIIQTYLTQYINSHC